MNVTLGDGENEVEFDDLIDQVCGVEIKHNIVDGKTYANVVDVFPESELGPEEEVAEDGEYM